MRVPTKGKISKTLLNCSHCRKIAADLIVTLLKLQWESNFKISPFWEHLEVHRKAGRL